MTVVYCTGITLSVSIVPTALVATFLTHIPIKFFVSINSPQLNYSYFMHFIESSVFVDNTSAILYFKLFYLHNIISPKLALCHNCLNCIIHTLRWVFMLFQKLFNHHTHFCSCRLSFLPVYRLILAERVRKLLCNSNKLVIFVKILNSLRFCQSIVKSKLFRRKSELISLIFSGCNLLCQLQHFFNDLFVSKHTI